MKKVLKISKRKAINLAVNEAIPKKSNITIIIAPGIRSNMEESLLISLTNHFIKGNVNVIRFNYPFLLKEIRLILGINSFKNIFRKIFHFIKSREEFRNDHIFLAGESFSSRALSRIKSKKISGYIFLGYPQHIPVFKIQMSNRFLFDIEKPMMFVQGTEDNYSENRKIEMLVGALKPNAKLMLIPQTDHSFKLLSTKKRTQKDINKEISDVILWFMKDVVNDMYKIN